MSRLDVLHHDVPFVIAPQDLGYGKALADCVEQVILHILEALDAVELLFDEVGDLLVQRSSPKGITSKSRPVTAFCASGAD